MPDTTISLIPPCGPTVWRTGESTSFSQGKAPLSRYFIRQVVISHMKKKDTL